LRPDADKIEGFRAWLKAQGAQMLAPKNEWEVLRFSAPCGTGVIYRNSKGRHTFNDGMAVAAYRCFLEGKAWEGKLKVRTRKTGKVAKDALLLRDGDKCFYCGAPLGEDITEEHLLSIAMGGNNHLANKVLTHAECNHEAGHMTIMEKVLLREKRMVPND
jgi:hypothetical protein